MTRWIEVYGARENNLRAVDVRIPQRSLTVVSGVSGSGKSSLAFDTVFREGQRRYLSSLSSHARQFIDRQHRPAVDRCERLPAALAVDQRTTVRNPRSTVGTLTEVHDHLRLLFARVGTAPDGIDAAAIGTHTFSFNSPAGACPSCNGLAVTDCVDPRLLVADPERTLRGGALVPTTKSGYIVYSQVTVDVLNEVCQEHGFDVDTPWRDLTPEQRDVIFFGSDRIEVPFGKHPLESRMRWSGITARPREMGFYKGLIPTITETLARNRNKNILRFVRSVVCGDCDGTRLNATARAVTVQGCSIDELGRMSLSRLRESVAGWRFEGGERAVAEPIVSAVEHRLDLLIELGLGYLRLDRGSTSLSGGEAQRIRLASQLGSGLHGLLYVLDEPSIGLHATDSARLIGVLQRLRDRGNTVLCVEHDAATIAAADHLVDLGPGAGEDGGRVLFHGDPSEGAAVDASPTLQWLRAGDADAARQARAGNGHSLTVRGASAHNLRDIDVTFRLGAFNVVTGVSGAGKSTLVDLVTARSLRRTLHGATDVPGEHDSIEGVEHLAKVVHIDQAPIGRTPRSNPATYTGIFDHVRDLFAAEPEASKAGLGKSHFSTNVTGGRCEECQGAGSITLGMHGLADVEVRCSACSGRRFGDATLAVRFRGHDIGAVLEASVDEALELFADRPPILRILAAMRALGLGYIRLGQSATTFSGGEAQRIKLATELARPASRGHVLYILDEPTTGLHGRDVEVLVAALNGLVDQGHTVLVIEHDLDIVSIADHVVDLGPGSGEEGGRVVCAGTPDVIAGCLDSATGRALGAFWRDGRAAVSPTPPSTDPPQHIRLAGVTTHNLRGIDVEIPHRALTVVTGVSGCGKSSLAFDTIAAEGRRRFAENLTTQARRHLPTHTEARFDLAHGLTPTIAIPQRRGTANHRRSTVATLTGIHEFLRLLYARAGSPRGELTASMFSFHHQDGACPTCSGDGVVERCDPDKLVSHPERSLFDGAMDGHKTGRFYGERDGQYLAILAAVEEAYDVDLHGAYRDLDAAARDLAMFGTGDREYDVTWKFRGKSRTGEHAFRGVFLGLARYVDDEYERKKLDRRGESMKALLSEHRCSACDGTRLRPAALAVKFGGLRLPDLCARSVTEAIRFLAEKASGELTEDEAAIAAQPVAEVLRRLRQLQDLGLGHLSLDRVVSSLSGGEMQRARLATQVGTRLTGATYVLDEPTVGLHPKDTAELLAAMRRLLEEECTVIVVEHDPQVWSAADHVIELGPAAGSAGGTIIAEGPPSEVTPPDLSALPARPLPDSSPIRIRGAALHNLRSIDVDLPTGGVVAITGVSGSGKTTLVFDVLAASIASGRPVGCASCEVPEGLRGVVLADDASITRTPRSTPATYLGVFDRIRKLFAATDEAKRQKLEVRAFSTTTKASAGGGRCEECQGLGAIRTSMDFLPDVWHPCEVCGGARFAAPVLRCTVRGRSIAEVLAMTAAEACEFFESERRLRDPLARMVDLGLGYLPLGQPGNTLSGGEAQRLKLASELMAKTSEPRLYLFDEPTVGLHAHDVQRLLRVMRELSDAGHTVLAVEHDLDVIRNADWVVDLGPGGGGEGGAVVYSGRPSDLPDCAASWTGRFL